MTCSVRAKAGGRKAIFLLLLFGLLMGASSDALAIDCVADAGGIIDGFVNYPVPPPQINLDGNCRIQNYLASNPMTSNFSFDGTLRGLLIIFDNVVFTGNMSCNASHDHKLWFTNGSTTTLNQGCQNILIPVEKIDKANPPGPPFVTIGVPFTWTLTIPVLFDPATGTIINYQGSVNDLHSITVVDDLNATNVDLTVVGYTINWLDDGTPVPHTFTNVGNVLTFDNIPIVTAGRQFAINLTVVLNNNPAVNAPGTQFINTAKWDFGRLIDGTFYEPLPGENGISPPLTISAPALVVDKTGPATMNLGQWGDFVLDVQNTGNIDAWDVSLRDLLPKGPTGGMCDIAPQILSARVFAADGVTPVPGKGPLIQGTDYSLNWNPGPCRLDLTMLTAAARIGPSERLIIRYRTQLDANTQDGVTLTNVAGAIQWYNGDSSNPDRIVTNETLTNGTVGVADHEDAHTVTVDLFGYFFEKTVANLTSGANPATTATPGDTLRYTLRFQATDQALANFRIDDVMDALNAPPAFAAGTLTLVSVPPGADVTNTSSTGGPSGTGVLDVRNLSLPLGSQLQIVFDITLRPALANGSVVTDQATFREANGTVLGVSDDPTVNGVADPFVAGDEDRTRVTIVSAPAFRIQKISTDLTGDPNVLLAGEMLRYTITVVNIGTEDAVNVTLRDAVPVNTTYVAGSTTLNGAPVADVAGLSPLINGMLIHPPSNPTPGSMPADPSAPPANVATITFDVVISPTVPDGTVISNQGFVSAPASGILDQPSDDPDTPTPNDPTRDIVGNLPLLYATKTVALFVDLGTPGVVDPGDTLRYTITVQNSGTIAATGVVLTDGVPANTTYVADSTRLNGLPVGQPDGGVPPLASGINISSSDLTPPLPGPGAGAISPGEAAVLQFDLLVDLGTPAGTLITNQAVVDTVELPNLLTDGDGNPANGAQPTVVVVGAVQQLSITKQVTVVGGGPALAGSTLEYLVTVTNIAALPAINVVITDTLPAGQLVYVGGSGTMNGSPAGVSVAGTTITANYAAVNGPLQPGEVVVLRFRAVLDPGLATGTVVTNTGVVAWNNPAQTANASVSIVVGGIPGLSVLSGSAWHDVDFDDTRDPGEGALAGWAVDLYRNTVLWNTVLTDAAGDYRFTNVDPNDTTGVQYEVRFRAPRAGVNTAMLGRADSPFTNGLQRISGIVVPPGINVQGLNLPIDPNGVVYNSMARIPVPGATLRLLNAGSGSPLPADCFGDPGDNGAQQGQITLADGWYKFDLNFSDPAACPSGGDYIIEVTPPPGPTYIAGPSQIIPPPPADALTAFDVPACPGDAVAGTANCEVQLSELAPVPLIPALDPRTVYHVHLMLSQPADESSQIFNNHIPLDPQLSGSIAISKTTPLLNVTRAQLVPYVITVDNVTGMLIADVDVVDRIPAGFVYVAGSALLDDVPTEPSVAGLDLRWDGLDFSGTQVRTVKLLLAVGAGVTEGEYVNRAQVVNGVTGAAISGEATATVRVMPDPTFDCTDVIGKVFNDANRNGRQDGGEAGLASVRVVTPRGLQAMTDQYGRYHITCAITPNESRGSNFVLKLDDRTLPSGFRLSTDQVQIKRATRGKALRIDFGASIHRVVAIDLSDPAFEPGTTEMRAQWRPRLDLLLEELRKAPSVLRLSYVADTEDEALVARRVEAVKRQVTQSPDANQLLGIEPEIFWRRGAPPKQPSVGSADAAPVDTAKPVDTAAAVDTAKPVDAAAPVEKAKPVNTAEPGEQVERHLSSDQTFRQWSQDPNLLDSERGDQMKVQQVVGEKVETVKLRNVVPPIRFESGVAKIPPDYVEKLATILQSMRYRRNVRVHFVGHADSQRLSGALARVFEDNLGLSRERAGEVAEYFKKTLGLPPEAITYEWVGDTQPVASNETEEGRALNRRVEVEVWYDQVRDTPKDEEVVVADDIKRIKICRTETLCKMRYKEGQGRRARVKNLVVPLRYEDEITPISEDFTKQVRQALNNLKDRQNVTVRFIGYTDDAPLTGRNERIYGNQLSFSKARAHRVALAMQEALRLPSSAIESDGRGATQPLASNETVQGRALNRRVEVEFWYDDPLQELPDEPQLCPGESGTEMVTKVYDPPWGALAALELENGQPIVPPGYAADLHRALTNIANRANSRVRFIGYTKNEHLDRRTASVYGDDIGLSAARARRAMDMVMQDPLLSGARSEHEGRGYVQSDDVVNGGFIQGEKSYVRVQVVYDEPAPLDDYEGVDITRLTRELRPKSPYDLNVMRITVDGKPIDDPERSSSDVQRCTDVALDAAKIQFHFDNLESRPRLSVSAHPVAVVVGHPGGGPAPAIVRFRIYNNYSSFIARAEIRIFDEQQSLQAVPLATIAVDGAGLAEWQPAAESLAAPTRELKYLLRAYDAKGHFDETDARPLWLYREPSPEEGATSEAAPARELLAAYGESDLARHQIPLKGGTVKVQGSGIPASHTVWVAGRQVPVDPRGNFAAEEVLPAGAHTVEVAVLDAGGNGSLYLRDLEFKRRDLFYVGVADFTLSENRINGPAEQLQGENAPQDVDSSLDGRLAFYVNGKVSDQWRLTASADTREGPVEDLFSNFLDKSPDSLFRRIDPDNHYPTFGDDSVVEEMAPTLGKLYVKASHGENYGMWGNFKVGYMGNELAQVDRGLYGANAHYGSEATTSFGERRASADGFAAEPGTVPSYEEFRGTGGSLYYLRHQDILTGSERVRIEIRDKDSGIVTGVVNLRAVIDYDIDYLQGRLLLSQPLSSTADDNLLVRSSGLSGDEAFLVARYEFTPGFGDLDAVAAGGQGHYWFGDHVRLGLTANSNEEGNTDSSLGAADLTLRKSSDSWLKVQTGRSEGLVSSSLQSNDGGFGFSGFAAASFTDAEAGAYRADLSLGLGDFFKGAKGRFTFYTQSRDAGYSAPGQATIKDTEQYGGTFRIPVTSRLSLAAKGDQKTEDLGLETRAIEVDFGFKLTDKWSVSTGVRNDLREDISPVTQEQGERTDAIAQVTFDSNASWRAYGFVQDTVSASDGREDNGRIGAGGSYRPTKRFRIDAEASDGDLGPGGKVGTNFLYSDRTNLYLNYSLENERTDNGLRVSRGNLVSGVKRRLSDSSSVYLEERYQDRGSLTGLTHATGINLVEDEHWNLGASAELGTLRDSQTGAETDRKAAGIRLGYGVDTIQFSSAIEYRRDDAEQLDTTHTERTAWLFRNTFKFQPTPDWRVLGKLNHSFSDSSLGELHDGGYTEAVVGYAYRPVRHDRLSALAKYTYFYNVPITDPVGLQNTPAEFLQKSHIAAFDLTYDVTADWTIGGKYAYRLGQASLDRVQRKFFDNAAQLVVLRVDWRFLAGWESLAEVRTLDLQDVGQRRRGALVGIYRYLGKHLKVGGGYNFSDFSDDLTDLSYDHQGAFFNFVGSM
jgi:uncharacterized repeat protein (TIGR01451 family)